MYNAKDCGRMTSVINETGDQRGDVMIRHVRAQRERSLCKLIPEATIRLLDALKWDVAMETMIEALD